MGVLHGIVHHGHSVFCCSPKSLLKIKLIGKIDELEGVDVRMKKWLLWTLGILSLGSGLIAVPARATDTAATANMPQGVPSIENIFTMPSLSGATNSGRIITSTNAATAGQQAVQLTDTTNQTAAVWSTPNNVLDLSKNQKASMWMYFGSKGDDGGEGMAFVLQNVGDTAITGGLTAAHIAGQTLGVWGIDYNKSLSSESLLASTAIQKSWALEFDEHDNSDRTGGNNDALDKGNGAWNSHIAWAYPAEASSYRGQSASAAGSRFTSLRHNNIINANLADGKWHHMTLDWTAPAVGSTEGTMTYTLEDKDPTTNLATTGQSQTATVDISKLGLTAIDALGSARNVYWGFTGATTSYYNNNVVAFDHVPGLVNATTGLTITDTTTGKKVTSGDQINGNDDLTYQYQLTYDNGNQDWTKIVAKLPKPNGVTFSAGDVQYADGSGGEKLSSSELTQSTITHTLLRNLSTSNKTATITLKGKADDVTSTTSVAAAQHEFVGSNQLESVASPDYTINQARKLTLAMDDDNGDAVKDGKSLTLGGTLTATFNGSDANLANSDVTIHTAIDNGNSIADFTMNGRRPIHRLTGPFISTCHLVN